MYCGCHGPNFGPEPHAPMPPMGGVPGIVRMLKDLIIDLTTKESELRTKADLELSEKVAVLEKNVDKPLAEDEPFAAPKNLNELVSLMKTLVVALGGEVKEES